MTMLESKRARWIAAAALALVLPGCASISKNECLTADWYAIGYESGLRGQRETEITQYRKACAEHGVTPDLTRFLAGRDAGLQRFCEPRNGYRLGRAGTGYGGVCPQDLERGFMQAYGAGRELYDTQRSIDRLGRRINALQADLKGLNEEAAEKQAELIAAGTTVPQRALLLKQLLELQDRMKHIEHDIHDARIERDRARAHLSRLERRPAAW
jgi:hypothetical protein